MLVVSLSSMGMLKKLVEETLNDTNVYVKSLEIGGSYVRDYESSYFIHPAKQANHHHNYSCFEIVTFSSF
jgi:hypothetical protein